ncbi:MAG: 5-formyltetrahydrofolate cyclo-ligase [Burkholderiaceae bacterium]|nr:MAG: 5-formyltetrahydrofolate cyclo-ligase [Burkholderiaceae bacterium]
MNQKVELRQELLQRRQLLPPPERAQAELALDTLLTEWFATTGQALQCIGAYWPIRGEPNLRPLLHKLVTTRTLVLPVSAAHQPLHFLRWTPDQPMQRDTYGITVPQGSVEAHPDCVLMPCLGFDRQGYRLGYGAGFYDRTLTSWAAENKPRPVVIGVSFACGVIDTAFHQPHDVPMDWCVTEQGMVKI